MLLFFEYFADLLLILPNEELISFPINATRRFFYKPLSQKKILAVNIFPHGFVDWRRVNQMVSKYAFFEIIVNRLCGFFANII
jgi:hypothetical protein